MSDTPHKRVHEYDGAFKCFDCQASWGALPGNPQMPTECVAPVRSGTQCACRFDDDDANIHTCDWHRDEFAKLQQQLAEATRALDNCIAAKNAEIAQLQQQLAEARKDAQRYRWLRDTPWPRDMQPIVIGQASILWDDAIDAALEASKP